MRPNPSVDLAPFGRWTLRDKAAQRRSPSTLGIAGSTMAFINEYIQKADCEKYDLRRVCGEHNEANRGHMYCRDWTIDRKRDAFLIQVWSHRDSEFSGWAFYWKGEWAFFEMRPADGKQDRANNTCWFLFLVKGFVAPNSDEARRQELLDDLQAAITASPGGMTWNYAHRSATIEFIHG